MNERGLIPGGSGFPAAKKPVCSITFRIRGRRPSLDIELLRLFRYFPRHLERCSHHMYLASVLSGCL